jgi:hypothetical protein
MTLEAMSTACEHRRVYTWIADDGRTLCAGCCDCGLAWTKPLRRKAAKKLTAAR